MKYNAIHLRTEIGWVTDLLRSRIQEHIGQLDQLKLKLKAPALRGSKSIYSQYVTLYKLTPEERVVLILALLPYVQPGLVEKTLKEFDLDSRQIPALGGVKGSHHGGMLPTAETALFLLAGNDLEKRFAYTLLFSPQHKFSTCKLLKLEDIQTGEPQWSGMLTVSKDVLTSLTSGTSYHPPFNSSFPAKVITTGYRPEQLVLHPDTQSGLEEIKLWLKHRDRLLNELGFGTYFSGGYKSLFCGPPGTGKSLTAALLGKEYGMPVYRIDLSMVISKYIGETEKNLSSIFDIAHGKNWMLFFDEADALFGKRSVTQTAQDRFANQEVSYLLIRMEEYDGMAILATNFKQNIDKAFLRRFDTVVNFPAPDSTERLRLWKQSFSEKTTNDVTVNLEELAKSFSLTGSNIMNIVRYASILALKQGNNIIRQSYIMDGIRRELAKEQALAADTVS